MRGVEAILLISDSPMEAAEVVGMRCTSGGRRNGQKKAVVSPGAKVADWWLRPFVLVSQDPPISPGRDATVKVSLQLPIAPYSTHLLSPHPPEEGQTRNHKNCNDGAGYSTWINPSSS